MCYTPFFQYFLHCGFVGNSPLCSTWCVLLLCNFLLRVTGAEVSNVLQSCLVFLKQHTRHLRQTPILNVIILNSSHSACNTETVAQAAVNVQHIKRRVMNCSENHESNCWIVASSEKPAGCFPKMLETCHKYFCAIIKFSLCRVIHTMTIVAFLGVEMVSKLKHQL